MDNSFLDNKCAGEEGSASFNDLWCFDGNSWSVFGQKWTSVNMGLNGLTESGAITVTGSSVYVAAIVSSTLL